MGTAITPDELADRLPELLRRVEEGESFRVEAGGREVAELAPAARTRVVTRELLATRLAGFLPVDATFADDLAEIWQAQRPSDDTSWVS